MLQPGGARPARYALAIFDFDGTLADSGDWFLSIADELADRFKFRRVPPGEVESLRGRTTREVIRHLGIPRWKLPAIGRYVHAKLATQIDRIALFDGVKDVIHTLADAGVRIAVVTSNSEDNARAVLGSLAARIEMFECGASLFGKAPRYRKVLRRMRISREATLSIGDETRDIAAARKVGITAGAVLWGYANREVLLRCEPDMVFEHPREVLEEFFGIAVE
ncbi:HAD hydrolase-like protein [Sphingomonas sp. H39-1-10]|uniref:HAD hydrolase-like protein n=1 Tax=Sphingomonas TaxID=13687 RepID=UPI00088F1E07|nr:MULTISPECIES: HAD hydrolase-like protein [Sphingomonas]MDF0486516.1 HAD hydrolase-like protein [Sphingomonas pollutisoli]SDA22385.1 phosphoglycolate phosphatase [Sphingomonas sp. NFR15]